MSDTLTRDIPGNAGPTTVTVRADRFGPVSETVLATRGKHDRKYNVKVRFDDLVLLDALADQQDIPRSVLLNNLLHEILLAELLAISEPDVRLLLARTADSRAHYDSLSQPWVRDAIQSESSRLLENIERYNQAALDVQDDPYAPRDHSWNSEKYFAVKEALEMMNK
jgi:hypothetical protein